MDDFEFTDVKTPSKTMSFTDIQNVFDTSKRKGASPAESNNVKKQK